MTETCKALLIIVCLTWWAPRGGAAVTRRESCVEWTMYYAREYHVPIELVEAVIDVESNWEPYAVSSKGAVGLMQLMLGTAVRFGGMEPLRYQREHPRWSCLSCLVATSFRGRFEAGGGRLLHGRGADRVQRTQLFLMGDLRLRQPGCPSIPRETA